MNKKQLIVGWVFTAILCIVILFAPQKHIQVHQGSIIAYVSPNKITIPKIQWDFVLQRTLIVLLIGGDLIYTVRDKKK